MRPHADLRKATRGVSYLSQCCVKTHIPSSCAEQMGKSLVGDTLSQLDLSEIICSDGVKDER